MITNTENIEKYYNPETNEYEIPYTEKTYISNIDGLKNFTLLKYEDEQEITLNTTENGKHTGHQTFTNNKLINRLWKMKKDEIITDHNLVKCVEIENGIL